MGTKIVTTHGLNPVSGDWGTDMVSPIYDVRRRAVTFSPGKVCNDCPMYIPIGDNLFDLQIRSMSKLSFEPKEPPALDCLQYAPWSWDELPPPPFDRMDVNSYTVDPDGETIIVSTENYPGDPFSTPTATFTFDTRKCKWEEHVGWSLPFTGRAYYVRSLGAFVGLSKDPATLGHLAYCGSDAVTHPAAARKLGKEKLFSDDPAEAHVSAKLVYMGSGGSSEFCLVQCVSVKTAGNGNADDNNPEETCYRYRLTTFCLSYDDNGDLTTGETSWVQCYEVPREATRYFMVSGDPVAFWLQNA